MLPITLRKLLDTRDYFEGDWRFLVKMNERFKAFPLIKGKLFGRVYGDAKALAIPGAYILINRRTGALYVGSATNVYSRTAKHRLGLKNSKHPNRRVQQDRVVSSTDDYDVLFFFTENRVEAFMLEQWLVDELCGRAGLCNLHRDVGRAKYRKRTMTTHVPEHQQAHYLELSKPDQLLGKQGGFHEPIPKEDYDV